MKVISNCDCQVKVIKFYIELFGFKCESVEKCDCCDCPTLVDGENTIRSIPSIIRYIGQKAHCQCYWGRDLKQQAGVDSAIECAMNMIKNLNMLHYLCSQEGASQFHGLFAKKLHETVLGSLACCEKKMSMNTFLVNERVSIADFLMYSVLKAHLMLVAKADAAKYMNVVRYMNTIKAQYPLVEQYFGVPEFAETAFTPKAFKVEQPAAQKQAEPAKPKEEPKRPVYNYTFNMDEWKRHYKNLNWDDGEDWQPYFYEKFNPEELSLWLITYKEPQNFKEDWKTKNLVSILLQRLRGEKADQNCFGNFIITKNKANDYFEICGVFLFPGKEVMQEWADCSGCMSFNFERIDDWEKPEVKAFIKANWDWSEETDMVYHGHNFGPCSDGCGETFV